MFINIIKNKFKIDEPILTDDIIMLFPNYNRTYIFRLINDAIKKGELVKFSRGVYYLPRQTELGLSSITADDVIERKFICENNKVFGIYDGISLLNSFFITTQVPNVIEIVTNNETMRKRTIIIDGRTFILRKSRFTITKNNVNVYIILQLFNNISLTENINSFSKEKIISFINENRISQEMLLKNSLRFPSIVLKNIVRSGILNEVA